MNQDDVDVDIVCQKTCGQTVGRPKQDITLVHRDTGIKITIPNIRSAHYARKIGMDMIEYFKTEKRKVL